jgi:hypothetical protein
MIVPLLGAWHQEWKIMVFFFLYIFLQNKECPLPYQELAHLRTLTA